MTKDLIAQKNMTLGLDFSRYVLEHPKFAEKIPENALVVLLPDYDPELSKANLEIAKDQRGAGQAVVYIHIEKLKPAKSRLVNPRLELQES